MAHELMHAVTAIREHSEEYKLAASYYHGEVNELFTSPAVKRALRGAVGGFDINLARRPVDAVLDRMQILAVTVPDDEAATRRLVDEVWTPNRMGRYAKTVHWAALTYGDAYLIAWPGEDDGTVELFYNSPVTTRVFYRAENPRVKEYAAKLWVEGEGDKAVHRVNLYFPDRIEKYATKPGSEGKEAVDFEEHVVEDEAWPLPNPFGEIPVFHFRTGEPYGRPEHRGAFGPQNAVTKLSSTLMSTVDYQGFPQRYALMNVSSADTLLRFEDEASDPDDAESTLVAGPGKLWKLPEASKVGQFDPANVQAFLDPISAYVRMMAAATATPLRFFDPQGQIPSGEALRADEAPLAARILDREDWFGEEWADALRFAALITGEAIPAVDIKWRPVQTVDDLTGWQTVKAKMDAGVPAEQALVEAGYTSELVEGWLAGSSKANFDTRVDSLVKLGQAMQYLGSAVQLGALDKGQVDVILNQTLADLVREDDAA